jgi:hypothetical protein
VFLETGIKVSVYPHFQAKKTEIKEGSAPASGIRKKRFVGLCMSFYRLNLAESLFGVSRTESP